MSVVKVYIVHGTSSQDFCTYSSIHQLIHDLLITVITFLKIDFAVLVHKKNIDSLKISLELDRWNYARQEEDI